MSGAVPLLILRAFVTFEEATLPSRLMAESVSISVTLLLQTLKPVDEIPLAYPELLFGGVQQIQLRTEDGENGDLGTVAP